MTATQIIDTDGVLDDAQMETIDQIIQALLITRRGTIPGSRSFGLTSLVLGAPDPTSSNQLAIDLAEGVAKYAPEVSIDKVEIESGGDGTLTLEIYIGGR